MNPSEITAVEQIDRLERRIEQLMDERDGFLAYAAFLQSETSLKSNYAEWTPAEAVEHVRRRASLTSQEASDAGWGARDLASFMDCYNAVKAAREREK